MGIEIERKYLVKELSFKEMASGCTEIRQGYLSRNPERTVRVRTRGDKGYITVKGKNEGMSRLEFEYEIPFSDAVRMLKLCEPPIIEKHRYIVEYKGMTWEVDCFHGAKAGLITAEIELPSEEKEFAIPPFVGDEVTGLPQYYNSNL